jgi:hypothetical protein
MLTSLIMRGGVDAAAVIHTLKPLPPSHQVIHELAGMVDELCVCACRSHCYDEQAYQARCAAQCCLLVLVGKGVLPAIDRLVCLLGNVLSAQKHQYSKDFWKWILQLCVSVDKALGSSACWMKRYAETAFNEVMTSSVYEVRRCAARDLIDMPKCFDMRGSSVIQLVAVDACGLINQALYGASEGEQALARKVVGLLIQEKNEAAIKQLHAFLDNSTAEEESYDFSRLLSKQELRPCALFDLLVQCAGPWFLSLFLDKGTFAVSSYKTSSLASVLFCFKQWARLSMFLDDAQKWRTSEGTIAWSLLRTDCMGLEGKSVSACIAVLLKHLEKRNRARSGSGAFAPLDALLWCRVFRVLLDMHVMWWSVDHMPDEFESTKLAADLNKSILYAHELFRRGKHHEARRKYTELCIFFLQYGVSLEYVEKQFGCVL